MNGQLQISTRLNSQQGKTYSVIKFLGAGGQGEVYDVECEGKHYALKWYFPHTATQTQRDILENLIAKGSPDQSFLWPMDLITLDNGARFGYIMNLRPSNYKSIIDLVKRRAEPSFQALCIAAFNLTKGYEKLHSMGFSYRDISFGNLFFDPNNGDVLICDNDNVSANGDTGCSVYGTPRFMAPEIVNHQAKPSRNTDLFSLAVLLFYMFTISHPLEGKLEADIKCMDVHAMNKLYGTNPVFIFDPVNNSNRPVRGYQDNALIYWDIYPETLKKLFIRSFTEGLKSPERRVTEREWLDEFTNLMCTMEKCSCGAENFYNRGQSVSCWNCGKTISFPPSFLIKRQRILLHKDARLTSHHINHDFDINKTVGLVVQNPNNPSVLGIRNEANYNWTYINQDGQQVPVAPGRSVSITKGMKIDFGQVTGELE